MNYLVTLNTSLDWSWNLIGNKKNVFLCKAKFVYANAVNLIIGILCMDYNRSKQNQLKIMFKRKYRFFLLVITVHLKQS